MGFRKKLLELDLVRTTNAGTLVKLRPYQTPTALLDLANALGAVWMHVSAAALSRWSEAMSLRSKPPVLAALMGGAFATMVLSSPVFPEGTQGASGPFEALAGLWSGNGVVQTSDGLHEKVRCKATYVAENAGHIVKLELRCASDAYKFELSSHIMQTGDSLSGNWFESTHRVGGSISGRNTGHEIDARAEGDTFTALLTVKTVGRRQSFLMESPGAKVSQVSINLSQANK
ncbi:MAG TPA: hypothetical protein VEK55_13435 [Xanthobacteraceae bacterium]|nr:hypothetical protein [Xanthobacteraceae bacterium]